MNLQADFDAWAQANSHLEKSTMVSCKAVLSIFIRHVTEIEGRLDRETFDGYISLMIASGKTRTTVQTHYGRIRQWINWLVETGRLEKNEMPKLRYRLMATEPIREMMVSEEQYAKIKQCCRDQFALEGNAGNWAWREWHAYIVLLWHTGLRSMDASQMKWECVRNGEITLTPNKTKRFGKIVAIPMAEELRNELDSLREWQHANELSIYPADRGIYLFPQIALQHRTRQDTAARMFRSLIGWAGVDGVTLHMFRHAFCSRLLSRGISPAIVASMSGHTISEMERYIHISSSSRKSAIDLASQTYETQTY